MSKMLPLTRGLWAIVDDEDYAALSAWKWTAYPQGKSGKNKAGRCGRLTPGGPRTTILMHRQIMGAVSGQEVDHINRDPLDNRRENLRFATREEQTLNADGWGRETSSRFKGVHKSKSARSPWVAHCRNIYLGSFEHEEVAAMAYNTAAAATGRVIAFNDVRMG